MFVISFIMQSYWRRQSYVCYIACQRIEFNNSRWLAGAHSFYQSLFPLERKPNSFKQSSIDFCRKKLWLLLERKHQCWAWRIGISCQNKRIAAKTLIPPKGTRQEMMKKWFTEHKEGSYLWIFSSVASFGVHVFGGLKAATSRIW